MLHLGCVTYNVLKDWDLETIIRKLEAAGFEAVELRTGHKHGVEPSLTREQRKQLTARFQKSKVRLLSFGSTCEFQSPDAAERRKQVEIGKQWVDLAHDTGAWGVKVRPNGIAARRAARNARFQHIAEACASWAITARATASRSGWKCTATLRRTRRSPPPS